MVSFHIYKLNNWEVKNLKRSQIDIDLFEAIEQIKKIFNNISEWKYNGLPVSKIEKRKDSLNTSMDPIGVGEAL